MKAKQACVCAFLISANLAAWLWALAAFGNRPALLGTAVLAYAFGLRHAFDADHIAAIDNAVRKLMQDGKAPFSVGLFFSAGHSTVVVLASVGVAATAGAFRGKLDAFHDSGAVLGTSVSALFLLLIGLANLLTLRSIWSAFVKARRGERIIDEDLDAVLAGPGLIVRIFRPLFRGVGRSRHMYPIGFLFGLGFDTATEIGLLGISAAQAALQISIWTILVFPALFAAGMSLMDTADSILMTRAYGWAFVTPTRKLWYNLSMTAISVAAAIFIGGIEVLGLIRDRLGFIGGFWTVVGSLNASLTSFGIAIVGIFIVGWLVSTMIYKVRGYDAL
jgi:high-affinity nickel-transport protein